ncbi:MAG: hypothetical protein HYV32_02805 [Candidatus Kerfeldbacteria bacterium]|nr:hypothetical protein [Candidatus Kerfeldbacteria bacterium]
MWAMLLWILWPFWVIGWQAYCLPVTLQYDLPAKLGNVLDRRTHKAALPEPHEQKKAGRKFGIFFCIGWNQCAKDFERMALILARLVKAAFYHFETPTGCGNIARIGLATTLNWPRAEQLLKDGYTLILLGYSRGGLNAIALARKLVKAGYPADRIIVITLASPIRGSYLGFVQFLSMLPLFPLLGWLPYFRAFRAAWEMVPYSRGVRRTQAAIRFLRKQGVQIKFFYFWRDSLVMKHQAAPPDEEVALIPGSCGHCSLRLISVLRFTARQIRKIIAETEQANAA